MGNGALYMEDEEKRKICLICNEYKKFEEYLEFKGNYTYCLCRDCYKEILSNKKVV